MESLLDSIWAPEEEDNEIVIQGIGNCLSINCSGNGIFMNAGYWCK